MEDREHRGHCDHRGLVERQVGATQERVGGKRQSQFGSWINDDGIVVDHSVEVGNPPDAPQLNPPSGASPAGRGGLRGRSPRPRLRREGRRGRDLRHRRCHRRAAPQGANPAPHAATSSEQRGFRDWSRGAPAAKAGSAARKRDLGLARTRINGIDGARTWCGHGASDHPQRPRQEGLLQEQVASRTRASPFLPGFADGFDPLPTGGTASR